MLFTDVAGNTGTPTPAQIVKVVPKSKVGTTLLFTVTVNVMGVAQSPEAGVNVYTPELVLLTSDGFHVPLIPFVELGFKLGMASSPAQIVIAAPKSNVGVMFGLTVTVKVVSVAHKPDVGVKVYVPEFWLSMLDGLQVPVILFDDVVGNAGAVASAQIDKAVPKLNVGVMFGFTVTVNVAFVAHWPAVGVNVYVPEF